MQNDGFFARWLWPLLASIAGGIVALSFRPWQKLTPREILMGVFVSASFGFFTAPSILYMRIGDSIIDPHVAGGLFFAMSAGSSILIPMIIKKTGELIGYRDPEQKP